MHLAKAQFPNSVKSINQRILTNCIHVHSDSLTSLCMEDIFNTALLKVVTVSSLKPEQNLVLKNVVEGNDVLAVLLTGFGESLTFQILPDVFREL